MGVPAVQVQSLSKEYRVGTRHHVSGTFYELLSNWLRLSRGGDEMGDPSAFWALRDVDFEIARGDVYGIVGRNGAGKSTLLKILSRITAPTKGRVTVAGRVASLLEVGTGFHPELTGRENVYLNATILGMKRAEIDRKLDAIVAFSGVEKFLDTPVKRYSSGMYVRLAFAVAAHVDADVLLVDEVLAVGDAEFQKRCLGMMGDVARGGRTVLFVSHNLTALRNLCTTGLLLKSGAVQAQGKIDDVLNQYAAMQGSAGRWSLDLARPQAAAGAYIKRIALSSGTGEGEPEIDITTPFSIRVEVEVIDADLEAGIYLHCNDSTGNRVFSHGSFLDTALARRPTGAGTHSFRCQVPADLLNAGEYSIDVFLIGGRQDVLASEPSAITFYVHDVASGVSGWNWPIVGAVRPRLAWSVQRDALRAGEREFAT